MKKRLLELSLGILALILLLPASSMAVNSKRFVPPTTLEAYALDPAMNLSVSQFAALSVKELQNMSHRKLNLQDKLAFKLTQRAIKKKSSVVKSITLTMLQITALTSVAFCSDSF